VAGVFYSESPLWYEKIGRIHALLERVKISEGEHDDALRLRRLSRVMSIHASTAIEGNGLSLSQVQDVVNGKLVYGPPKDVKEVQNAWLAYNMLADLDPWSVESLLNAHALMTNGLIGESGAFRSVGVSVVRGDGTVLHRGADSADVPRLVKELFDWGKENQTHPLIKSSAVHFMIEYIHPFRDGNGRIGRLWQTLILSKWSDLFAWMPVETLVHCNQALYYKALQDSHSGNLDCKPFIDFMLDAIENSMYRFIDVASETMEDDNLYVHETRPYINNDPVSDRVKGVNIKNDPVDDHVSDINTKSDPVNDLENKFLRFVQTDPTATYGRLADELGKSPATVKRLIRKLKDNGVIIRVGSDKSGRWEVRKNTGKRVGSYG